MDVKAAGCNLDHWLQQLRHDDATEQWDDYELTTSTVTGARRSSCGDPDEVSSSSPRPSAAAISEAMMAAGTLSTPVDAHIRKPLSSTEKLPLAAGRSLSPVQWAANGTPPRRGYGTGGGASARSPSPSWGRAKKALTVSCRPSPHPSAGPIALAALGPIPGAAKSSLARASPQRRSSSRRRSSVLKTNENTLAALVALWSGMGSGDEWPSSKAATARGSRSYRPYGATALKGKAGSTGRQRPNLLEKLRQQSQVSPQVADRHRPSPGRPTHPRTGAAAPHDGASLGPWPAGVEGAEAARCGSTSLAVTHHVHALHSPSRTGAVMCASTAAAAAGATTSKAMAKMVWESEAWTLAARGNGDGPQPGPLRQEPYPGLSQSGNKALKTAGGVGDSFLPVPMVIPTTPLAAWVASSFAAANGDGDGDGCDEIGGRLGCDALDASFDGSAPLSTVPGARFESGRGDPLGPVSAAIDVGPAPDSDFHRGSLPGGRGTSFYAAAAAPAALSKLPWAGLRGEEAASVPPPAPPHGGLLSLGIRGACPDAAPSAQEAELATVRVHVPVPRPPYCRSGAGNRSNSIDISAASPVQVASTCAPPRLVICTGLTAASTKPMVTAAPTSAVAMGLPRPDSPFLPTAPQLPSPGDAETASDVVVRQLLEIVKLQALQIKDLRDCLVASRTSGIAGGAPSPPQQQQQKHGSERGSAGAGAACPGSPPAIAAAAGARGRGDGGEGGLGASSAGGEAPSQGPLCQLAALHSPSSLCHDSAGSLRSSREAAELRGMMANGAAPAAPKAAAAASEDKTEAGEHGGGGRGHGGNLPGCSMPTSLGEGIQSGDGSDGNAAGGLDWPSNGGHEACRNSGSVAPFDEWWMSDGDDGGADGDGCSGAEAAAAAVAAMAAAVAAANCGGDIGQLRCRTSPGGVQLPEHDQAAQPARRRPTDAPEAPHPAVEPIGMAGMVVPALWGPATSTVAAQGGESALLGFDDRLKAAWGLQETEASAATVLAGRTLEAQTETQAKASLCVGGLRRSDFDGIQERWDSPNGVGDSFGEPVAVADNEPLTGHELLQQQRGHHCQQYDGLQEQQQQQQPQQLQQQRCEHEHQLQQLQLQQQKQQEQQQQEPQQNEQELQPTQVLQQQVRDENQDCQHHSAEQRRRQEQQHLTAHQSAVNDSQCQLQNSQQPPYPDPNDQILLPAPKQEFLEGNYLLQPTLSLRTERTLERQEPQPQHHGQNLEPRQEVGAVPQPQPLWDSFSEASLRLEVGELRHRLARLEAAATQQRQQLLQPGGELNLPQQLLQPQVPERQQPQEPRQEEPRQSDDGGGMKPDSWYLDPPSRLPPKLEQGREQEQEQGQHQQELQLELGLSQRAESKLDAGQGQGQELWLGGLAREVTFLRQELRRGKDSNRQVLGQLAAGLEQMASCMLSALLPQVEATAASAAAAVAAASSLPLPPPVAPDGADSAAGARAASPLRAAGGTPASGRLRSAVSPAAASPPCSCTHTSLLASVSGPPPASLLPDNVRRQLFAMQMEMRSIRGAMALDGGGCIGRLRCEQESMAAARGDLLAGAGSPEGNSCAACTVHLHHTQQRHAEMHQQMQRELTEMRKGDALMVEVQDSLVELVNHMRRDLDELKASRPAASHAGAGAGGTAGAARAGGVECPPGRFAPAAPALVPLAMDAAAPGRQQGKRLLQELCSAALLGDYPPQQQRQGDRDAGRQVGGQPRLQQQAQQDGLCQRQPARLAEQQEPLEQQQPQQPEQARPDQVSEMVAVIQSVNSMLNDSLVQAMSKMQSQGEEIEELKRCMAQVTGGRQHGWLQR